MPTTYLNASTNLALTLNGVGDALIVTAPTELWNAGTPITFTGNLGSILNRGSIAGLGPASPAIDVSGIARGTLVNRGSITSAFEAVHIAGAAAFSLTNSGTIDAVDVGILLDLTTAPSGTTTIRNAGFLSGSIGIDSALSAAGFVLVNAGTIEGRDSFGIQLGGALGTINRITNAGTIDGETGAISTDAAAAANDEIVNTGRIFGAIDLGAGDDSYDGLQGRVVGLVSGGLGSDTLLGGAAAERFSGGDGDDRIEAGDGNDWIDGGAGADEIDGGGGRDTISYASATASVTVDLGDPGRARGDAALDLLAGIEAAVGSSFGDTLTGDEGINRLEGGGGPDTLDGKLGADTLVGGLGDDRYVVDNAKDIVIEKAGEGNDRVEASASFSLTSTADIETLATLDGTFGNSLVNLTGSDTANVIYGNFVQNLLLGRGGNDTIWAGVGNDTLDGGDGNDSLNAGAGNDTLVGGAGVDTMNGDIGLDFYVFDQAPGDVDVIVNFTTADDTIRMENSIFTVLGPARGLNVNYFRSGAAALDADDFVVFNPATRQLFYDPDGSGAAAAELIATITTLRGTMAAADFVVI